MAARTPGQAGSACNPGNAAFLVSAVPALKASPITPAEGQQADSAGGYILDRRHPPGARLAWPGANAGT
jgi:hypothetical protein